MQDGLEEDVDAIYIGSLPVHIPTEEQEVPCSSYRLTSRCQDVNRPWQSMHMAVLVMLC